MSFDDAREALDALRASGVPLLRVKIPPHYEGLVKDEIAILGRRGGPLYLVAYPGPGRFSVSAPGEVASYVQESKFMPTELRGCAVHRYPSRLLYLPTDECVGHCQYCFRVELTGVADTLKSKTRNLRPEVVSNVVSYLRAHPAIREVIFSGGDPLACPADDLDRAASAFLGVPTVRWIRFHTRAPIFSPQSVSTKLIDLCARHRIRVVLHVVHPYEITAELDDVLKRWRRAGVQLYNQFPILRGINDHPDVILELGHQCADRRIQMLTMFVPDPVFHSAVYRPTLARAFAIADQVFARSPSWMNSFRVCLDTSVGKVRREDIVAHDAERNRYVFRRESQEIEFFDLPAELDRETPAEDLLYRGAEFVDC